MTHAFPQTPDFIVHNEPVRIECDIYDLIVEGKIPEEINGVWYRSIPDPQYPSKEGNDVFISGDGMVGAFYFENGHVDYKCRYVMTERLKMIAPHGDHYTVYIATHSPMMPAFRGKVGASPILPLFIMVENYWH